MFSKYYLLLVIKQNIKKNLTQERKEQLGKPLVFKKMEEEANCF